ncbi:MAG: YjjG family noncanonical pyrimidine nucleotidase [Prevotella sp.]|jgi:putative hydrolase of the HAD superfamily
MMKTYSDLFFDFDDTLYDTHGNATIALGELFDEFRLDQYFDDARTFYDAYWKTNVELWAQYSHGEISRDYLIIERFKRPLSLGRHADPAWPDDDYCLRMSDRFLALCSVKPGVVAGARELVDYLHGKGYRMHICSNGFHEVQYRKLKACGLYDYFDTIILSEDADVNKPSKQFFDFAFRTSGASPETTLMIGDNYNTDIEGAMNAGIDTLFFKRWDASFVPPRPVTYEVETLRQIMEVL